jgi:hypothetical protein
MPLRSRASITFGQPRRGCLAGGGRCGDGFRGEEEMIAESVDGLDGEFRWWPTARARGASWIVR